ncbi:MAG TPA: helix-turn-helix transcriptional regulator [Ilumatobacteraceae bacterium]
MHEIDRRVADLGEFIRQQRETTKMSVRRLAELAEVSNPYLSQIERGLRKPSAEILQQIARALRISAEQLYVRAGIRDPNEAGLLSVPDAINLDPRLTAEQKTSLLTVYESFVKAAVTADVTP